MLFSAVDSWLERVTGGQVLSPEALRALHAPQERLDDQGQTTLGRAAYKSFYSLPPFMATDSSPDDSRAVRSAPRSGNRAFFGLVGFGFLTAATWRAVRNLASNSGQGPQAPPYLAPSPLPSTTLKRVSQLRRASDGAADMAWERRSAPALRAALRLLGSRFLSKGPCDAIRPSQAKAFQQEVAGQIRRSPAHELPKVFSDLGGAVSLDFFNLLTALQRAAKGTAKDSQAEQMARELLSTMTRRLVGTEEGPRGNPVPRLAWLARAAWAAARLAHEPKLRDSALELLSEVERTAVRVLTSAPERKVEPRDAAQLLWAMATWHVACPSLLQSLSPQLRCQRSDAWAPQDTSNLLWAMGRLGGAADVVEALVSAAAAQGMQMEVQGLCAALTACAQRFRGSISEHWPKGLEILVQTASDRVEKEALLQDSAGQLPRSQATGRWRPAELVQVLWALAALGVESPPAAEALRRRGWETLSARDLSLVAWSFAATGMMDPRDLEAIAKAATPKIQDFDAQGLSNLCWALGCAKVADRALFTEVGKTVQLGGRAAYSAQQMANICWSYATQAFLHRPLFQEAASFAHASPESFRSEELSALVWSMATLALPWEGLAKVVQKALPSMSAREGANLAWACAVLGEHREDVLRKTANLLQADGESAQELHLGQWYLAYLAYTLETPPGEGHSFSAVWLERCRVAAQRRATTQGAASSRLHSSVSEEVRRCLRSEPVVDEFVVEQCLAVDIALPSRRLAVEVDGPVHFARDVQSEALSLLGPSWLKRRLLTHLGWQVVSVEWRDWDRLDRAARRSFLVPRRRRLQEARRSQRKREELVAQGVLGLGHSRFPRTLPGELRREMDEKYQRIKVLGKGSFGKAYLVRNTEENELCVVKQMETSAMEAKERNEAVKEAMLLKKMDHPNIVRFKEVFITRKHRLCIVMDYADGGDVHMKIKSREGALLPEEQILEWFVQTCFALKHVHERKVLHRDLKTQNIFLMSNGHVKLGDFGIARVLDATKDYARTMVGTPYYLSPEIIEDRPYNFKSDIWSLGVVLYEMTTLKHPFDADSLVILASKILKDQYPPPDSSYSPDLLSLIRSMLCKDAQQRPLITKVLCYSFLQDIMQHANSTYHLGLDLSEFAKALPGPETSVPNPPGLVLIV
ncbi:NEK1 [Symbiodinium microadriaticum]|nr:NEK1 [Symbiodinium microadriaticum]